MGEVSMRFAKSGPAAPESSVIAQQAEQAKENFGLTALTSCLVDADGNTTAGAGRARRKALGVSALIQFCTLVALLVVPLFATGSRLILRPTNFVPLPPYGGAPRQAPADSQRPPSTIHHSPTFPVYRDVIQMPTRPQTKYGAPDEDAPKLGSTTFPNSEVVLGSNGPAGPANIIS